MSKNLGWMAAGCSVIVAAMVGGFIFGFSCEYGRQQAQDINRAEIIVLSANNDFLNQIDSADAVLWTALIQQAEICDDCSGLVEFQQNEQIRRYPIVVRHYDREHSIGYTMVMGVATYAGDRVMVVPAMRYYISYRSGARLRIGSEGAYAGDGASRWTPTSFRKEVAVFLASAREMLLRERQKYLTNS
jgi:hypothetical protein